MASDADEDDSTTEKRAVPEKIYVPVHVVVSRSYYGYVLIVCSCSQQAHLCSYICTFEPQTNHIIPYNLIHYFNVGQMMDSHLPLFQLQQS